LEENTMFLPLSLLLVAIPLASAVADPVPAFDLHPTCRGSAATAGGGGSGLDVCLHSERSARDKLAQEWSEFSAADRSRCIQLTHMTRMPSYVQVLTCLEMARDARAIAGARERGTVGMGR
jgi:hypothetical protein